MITNESLVKLKENLNIIDVISRFIPVIANGKNAKCVCPFHADKNPSMSINSDGYFYCFGCGAKGDAISFVMQFKGLDFSESVRFLANMYGINLTQKAAKKLDNSALICLQELFVSTLATRNDIQIYLAKRGIDREQIVQFGIGYAPSTKQVLAALQNAGISQEIALKQGAIKQGENGIYASFSDRITFPIYNQNSLLVGFGGRTLNPNNPAKYVNSPASYLFDKKQIFYGFVQAKKGILQQKRVIICEGYMDTVAFFKAGINYAVAVLGTALTPMHLKFLRKDYQISLCFDKDEAGQKAAFKAAKLLSENSFFVEVITLTSFKDPGEFVQNNQVNKLFDELKNSCDGVYFCMDFIFKNSLKMPKLLPSELNSLKIYDIKIALDEVKNYLSKIDNLIASINLKKFCEFYKIDYELIKNQNSLQNPLPKTPTQNLTKSQENFSNFEDEILYFLLNSKQDFGVLILEQYFQNPLFSLVKQKDFSNLALLEFKANIGEKSQINDILAFFGLLAKHYANASKNPLFLYYAQVLKARPKIAFSQESLKQAYFCLLDLIASLVDLQIDSAKLKEKIKNLGV